MSKAVMKKPASSAKAKWSELGTVRQRLSKDGKKVNYLVLNKNVTILVEGEEVDLGTFRTVSFMDPQAGLDSLLSGGHIDQDEYDKRISFNEEKGVKYRLTVPPVKNDE
jgi:hypothetical protein